MFSAWIVLLTFHEIDEKITKDITFSVENLLLLLSSYAENILLEKQPDGKQVSRSNN